MTQNKPASPQAEDYDAIHTAVMETSRGNWFLTEFARRNRNADTTLLLAAIKRIESAMRIQTAIPAPSHVTSHVTGQAGAPDQGQAYQGHASQGQASTTLGHQLHELRDAIVLTRESLPTVGADGRIALRNADFTRIAAGIDRVAAHMRATAQQAQETAQSLRERAQKEFGIEKDALDRRAGELEAHARELAGFCAQLDEQTESAQMVATLLAEIETQLDGLIAQHKHAPAAPVVINAPPSPPQPQAAAPAPSQSDPKPAEARAEPVAPVAVAVPLAPQVQVAVAAPPSTAPMPADMPAEPVAVAAPPAPPVQVVVPQPQPAPEAVQITEPVATQAVPEPAAIEPAAAPEPAAPPDNRWMENLAPPVRTRHAPDTPANFDFAEETKPAIALPNPAMREAAETAPEKAPPEQVAEALPAVPPQTAEPSMADAGAAPTPMVPRIKVMPQATVPTPPTMKSAPRPDAAVPARSEAPDDPTDFLFEPLPQMPEPHAAPAMNGGAHAKPGAPPIKPADPLAPIMALSDEEKIALFS